MLADDNGVTSPSFCSYQYQYIWHLTRDVVGSCTCNAIVSIETFICSSRGRKNMIPEAIRCPRVLVAVRICHGYDVEVLRVRD